MTEILKAVNIIKTYNAKTENAFTALKGISLTINEDDFVCVMGPSGSGKTTLINNLSTIDRPTKGSVYILGENVSLMNDRQVAKFRSNYMGFIFQDFNLIDTLSCRENIAIPLIINGLSNKEIDEKITAVAKKLEIYQLLKKFPTECSIGQKQRVAIARALVADPKLIVADEPTGNLDSEKSHEVLEILQKINKENHVAIMMVTHDPAIASYTKKLLYLKDGDIVQTLDSQGLTQKEYYQKIVELNSSKSQLFLHLD